jgi:two-component system response regulator YesN
MLRLMIVDDESLFREAMKITLPWEKLGFEVCCEAENGYDALEKIAEHKPDVALVDINMPVMDGLELAAEIKEKELDVKVIIITGYGEFSYARQAIEVGVGNYLLKPVEEDELVEALNSIKTKIEKERTARLETEALIQQVNDYKPILKEMLLNDLIQGNRFLSTEEFSSLINHIKINQDCQSYQVGVIELDEKSELCWNSETRQMYCFALSNIADELLKNCCPYELCRDTQGRLNILLFSEPMEDNIQLDAMSIFETIRLTVPKLLGITVSIGIGKPYEHIQQLSLSYKEALYAVKNKLVIGENSVISYEDISDYKLDVNFYPIERKMQLHVSLRISDLQEAERIIRAVFKDIRTNNPPGEMARFVSIEIVSSLLEFVSESGGDVKSIFGEGFNILEEVQNKKNLDELESWILGLLSRSFSYIGTGRSKRPSKIVEDARKYINENYARYDLKIDEIARNVFVKYGHLCFLFKRETGKTINEYISELRILKAKELIDSGCHSISMVAAKVGYADANYFSKCFKKFVGITPGKYIESFMPGQA